MGTTTTDTACLSCGAGDIRYPGVGLCAACYTRAYRQGLHLDYPDCGAVPVPYQWEDDAALLAHRRARLRAWQRHEAVARHAGPFITGAREVA